jgi:hypothetical protein
MEILVIRNYRIPNRLFCLQFLLFEKLAELDKASRSTKIDHRRIYIVQVVFNGLAVKLHQILAFLAIANSSYVYCDFKTLGNSGKVHVDLVQIHKVLKLFRCIERPSRLTAFRSWCS